MSYIGNPPSQIAFLTDQFSGNGSTTAFTMSVAPATTTSVLVAITGVLQDPTTYSVVGTTLTFSAAPPTGTGNISVRYLGIPASGVTTTAYRTVTEFTATAGQTTFTPPSYTVGFIAVYRNGVRLAAADYTASNGTTVVLTAAATLNDLVVTESFYVSSVLNAIPATAGSVQTSNIADANVTTAKIADANVTQAKLATLVTPVGVGQTWMDVGGSRAAATTYTNTTGRPIEILLTVYTAGAGNQYASFYINGVVVTVVGQFSGSAAAAYGGSQIQIVIPSGATYSYSVGAGTVTIYSWWELR